MAGIDWRPDLDEAAREARDSGRLLLVVVEGDDEGASPRLAEAAYADERVQALLHDAFVAVRLDRGELDAEGLGVVWTPTFILLDSETECHRQVGCLDAADLLAMLLLGQAKAAMGREDFDAAVRWLKDANDRCRDSHYHDAILYWFGVASLQATGRDLALRRAWQRLRAEHPESPWAAATAYLFE